jgi:hypothetical protein
MRAREKKAQESEWQRDEFFNKLQPMVPQQQWMAKVVSEALKETRVEATEEWGATDADVGPVDKESAQDRSDRPATPIRPVDGVSMQTGAEVPALSHSCSNVTAPIDDEEEMLDYEPSPVWEDMDVNVI